MDYVCIKCPIFSFKRLKGVDPILKVEMGSTGEVACFGNDKFDAYLKSLISSDKHFKKYINTILLSFDLSTSTENMKEIFRLINLLKDVNITIYTTEETHQFLDMNNINNISTNTPIEDIKMDKIDLVINIPQKRNTQKTQKTHTQDINYRIRREAIDCSIPLITNIKKALLFILSIRKYKYKNLEIKSWQEYLQENII